ncbi:retropepsin-like aspartic peptidase RloA3 [Metapseudomonas boanensis]|uniref:ATP-dependent zinc protease n=1 Tax=Metapseudomonas boanensis TaxID=2822138 RepID=A0ABS5XL93_9GAMM|nr:ATP-dependent zinc protease [Pseudomonas boanensis]MBT8768472.1 ATP-dependent zinc protease [Pseudomonas boanensis]
MQSITAIIGRSLGLLVGCLFAVVAQAQPQVVGWVEEAVLLPENVQVKAKMDTGALTSSLDAKEIERFERNGEKWVRFKVELTDSKTGNDFVREFERPVVRNVKVRGAGGVDHRSVVEMSICIGKQRYDEQFSLRNRSKMLYPVLIGRRTLEHLGLVDVSRTFTLKPQCGL